MQSDLQPLAFTTIRHPTSMEKSSINGTNQSSDQATPSFDEYISNQIEECDHVTQVKVSKVATLEQRYIALLEKRIACLEEAVESQGSEVLVSAKLTSNILYRLDRHDVR